MKKTSSASVLLISGLLLSLLTVIALPGLYFHKDLEIFWKWSQIWKLGWQNIYIACPDCNYPILGMFGSAGVMRLLDSLGFDRAVFSYRLLLSIIDGLNVYIVYCILKRLKVEKAAYTAGIIGISISSWAGGALWGQIDNLSQFFILLTLAWVINKNTVTQSAPKYPWPYLVISAILIACILLTKQLAIFSVFSIGILLTTDILFHSRAWKPFLLNMALVLGSIVLALVALDPFLKIKPPYFSHLIYIWQEGVFQAGIISGNGFNLWMLLGRDMWSSAHIPLFPNMPLASPYLIGQVLFLGMAGVLTLSYCLMLRKHYQFGERKLNRELLLNFILHLALINLCFNVFLTGTRERYLFHFYPYVILAWSGLAGFSRLFSEKILSVLVLGASLYGIFILQILSTIDFQLGIATHLIMGVFHAGLFVCLVLVTLRYQKFLDNLGLVFKKSPKNLPTVR